MFLELRPCIQLNIEVEQVYKGFIVQVYLPSSAILFMLWLGFWLNFKEVSARIRIVSVAFTLTVTQMVGVMIVFPDIVELEPLVVWNAFCLGMNILAFIEFLVVHNMYMNIQLKKAQSQELTVTPPSSSAVSMQVSVQLCSQRTRLTYDIGLKCQLYHLTPKRSQWGS